MRLFNNILIGIVLILSGLTVFLCIPSCNKNSANHSGGTLNAEAMITAVDLKDMNGKSVILESSIDPVKLTVSVLVEEGSDLSKLSFYPTVSDGATVEPKNGSTVDFLIPAKLAVTSEDGRLTNDWFVLVREEKASEALILSIDDVKDKNDLSVIVSNTIDAEGKSVSIIVKERADITKLKLFATISEGASMSPASGTEMDFTKPVKYAVSSKNKKVVNEWLITVNQEMFVDYDSGFDYDLSSADWTLQTSEGDDFNPWRTDRWEVGKLASGEIEYTEDNVINKQGKLRIFADFDGKRHTCGKVTSRFLIGGDTYIKIRAKSVNTLSRLKASISLGDNLYLMQSVLGEPTNFTSSLHVQEGELLDIKKTDGGSDLSSDYHVFGIERRKELIRFFFDGNMVWEYEIKDHPEFYNKPLSLTLGILGVADVQPDDMKLPAYLMVDYVKVYKAVNNGALIPTYGENVVVNPGFESAIGDDHPEGWTVIKTSGKSVVWVFRDSHGHNASRSRFHFGMDHEPSTFDYTLSQKLTNIPDGLYRLEVWAYMVEGKSPADPDPYLFARGHASSDKKILIDAVGGHYDHDSYRRYIIDNIYVKGGTCEIGVRSVSNSNGLYSVFVDDFSLTKVNY